MSIYGKTRVQTSDGIVLSFSDSEECSHLNFPNITARFLRSQCALEIRKIVLVLFSYKTVVHLCDMQYHKAWPCLIFFYQTHIHQAPRRKSMTNNLRTRTGNQKPKIRKVGSEKIVRSRFQLSNETCSGKRNSPDAYYQVRIACVRMYRQSQKPSQHRSSGSTVETESQLTDSPWVATVGAPDHGVAPSPAAAERSQSQRLRHASSSPPRLCCAPVEEPKRGVGALCVANERSVRGEERERAGGRRGGKGV